jgi:hypothetical protein
MNDRAQRFSTALQSGAGGRVYIELPFDVADVWGEKDRHHVRGTINSASVRGPLVREGSAFLLILGPAWRRDGGFSAGDVVEVMLEPEGPQRDELAPDIVAALDAEPEARRFFEALPTFYRKGYLRWVDATKRRPDVRTQRIEELVQLLKDGKKERPD